LDLKAQNKLERPKGKNKQKNMDSNASLMVSGANTADSSQNNNFDDGEEDGPTENLL
jgi:hypothetical protein